MLRPKGCNTFGIEIGITILTAMTTGIVLSYIYTLHTATFLPLIFIFTSQNFITSKSAYQLRINTTIMLNSIGRKIHLFCMNAGI